MSELEIERDSWLRRFYEGKCGLADLIFFTMQSGAPASPQVLEIYSKALTDYEQGGDIEQLLGLHRVKGTTIKKWDIRSRVLNLVEDSKLPKSDPSYYENTAFHEIADKICLSPSRVYDIYRDK